MSQEKMIRAAIAASGVKALYYPGWNNKRIAGRGAFEPRFVVLHHTVGTNSLFWLAQGKPHPPVPGAHFLIAKDGTVHVLTAFTAYHAGKGDGIPGVARDSLNRFSFGIEVESLGKVKDFTPAQTDAVVRLTRALLDQMNRPVTAVLNHKTWSRTGKPDTLYSDAYWRAKILAAAEPKEPEPTPEAPVVNSKPNDDWLSLKEKSLRPIQSNRVIYIDINGKSEFKPEEDGRGGYAVYANLKLPPPMTPERAALERGKVRTWYEQMDGKLVDETGLNDARRIGLYGNRRCCIAHFWPHTKSRDTPVRFCIYVEAWNVDGTTADVKLHLGTREVKIVGEDD